MNAEKIAARFNCTPEQVRAQYRRNAVQLAAMAERARKTGKRVNGYTADELDERARIARLNAGERGAK